MLVEEKIKIENLARKIDFGVFSDSDSKFLGPEFKFERNWRKRFSRFRNQICCQKNQNRNSISGLEVGISYISEIQIFRKSKFQILAESVFAF